MVEFRRIKMSLFLPLVLQFTAAATGRRGLLFLSFTVRVGADVTLPCENVMDDQNNCNRTTWAFGDSLTASEVELIKLGRIGRKASNKSDRLSVTENCSLVIKEVTAEDAGRYDCQQINKSGHKQGQDGRVLLSVATMTEMMEADRATLNCSVSVYERCTHTVKWLFEGRDMTGQKDKKTTSRSSCSSSVVFTTSVIYESVFMCEVYDGHSGQVQQFPYRVQREKPAPAGCSAVNYIMLVLRVAEVVLITVITVLLIRAPGNQRPPDDNTLSKSGRRRPVRRSGAAASQVNDDEDEDDGVVNYENLGNSVRLH